VTGIGNTADERLLDFERRGAGGIEVGEWILEEGFNAVGGNAACARDLDGRGAASSERT
jgi:hypothetical protein